MKAPASQTQRTPTRRKPTDILAPHFEIAGIVLDRQDKGESSLLFRIFSPERGLVAAMRKVSATKTSVLPDLFDQCFFELAPLGGDESSDLFALKDFSVNARMTGIPEDYARFSAAARICSWAERNGRYCDRPAEFYKVITGALQSLNGGANADLVLLKFLYVFCRDEGYAVREDFIPSLEAEDAELLKIALRTPSKEMVSSEAPHFARLLRRLEAWAAANTDILLS